jgi:predicted nucleic acid-binding protein
MTLIVDASVAAKWYLAEADSDSAQHLFDAGHEFLAPELLLAELANTLFKAWSRGAIDDLHMDRSIGEVTKAIATFWPLSDLVADAMVISRIIRHPVYDCVYLALGWRTGARIVTADERFLEVARATSWDSFLLPLREAV